MRALVTIGAAKATETSLSLPDSLSLREWANVGEGIGRLEGCRLTWLGDWYNHGKDHYGEDHAQFLDNTGYQYSTLANASWVCNAFPKSKRPHISFGHLQALARLPDEIRYATAAKVAEKGLTIPETRDLARKLLGKKARKRKRIAGHCPDCQRKLVRYCETCETIHS